MNHIRVVRSMSKITTEAFFADPAHIPEPDEKFLSIVTRPPVPLRSIDPDGVAAQPNVNAHLSMMEDCANEWLRLLNGDGLLWLNLTDVMTNQIQVSNRYRFRNVTLDLNHVKTPAQWANLPHKILEVFTSCGWLYRSCIIWDRMEPIGRHDRTARKIEPKHEYVFMLAKNRSHRFFDDRLVEKNSVWSIPLATGHQHRDSFPVELPRRCIPLSTQRYEWVLDPWCNVDKTTNVAARQLGCNSVSYLPRLADLDKTA